MVASENNDDVWTGLPDRLRAGGESVPKVVGSREVFDLGPMCIHQCAVRGAHAQHDSAHDGLPVVTRWTYLVRYTRRQVMGTGDRALPSERRRALRSGRLPVSSDAYQL